jgi:hypothetical protein
MRKEEGFNYSLDTINSGALLQKTTRNPTLSVLWLAFYPTWLHEISFSFLKKEPWIRIFALLLKQQYRSDCLA